MSFKQGQSNRIQLNIQVNETIKNSGINNMLSKVKGKMLADLEKLQYVNVSCDGWSDRTMRCFNGFIAQGKNFNRFIYQLEYSLYICGFISIGIDENWNLLVIPIGFQHVTGSHTGEAI